MGLVWSVTKKKSLRFPTHLVYGYDEQRLRSEPAFFFFRYFHRLSVSTVGAVSYTHLTLPTIYSV